MRRQPKTVEIEASNEQLQFLSSTASNVVFQGGARSGKTWAGVLKALLMLAEQPGVVGMYVAPTYKQLGQAAEPHLVTLGDKLGMVRRWQRNKTEGTISLPGGGTMLLRSTDNPEGLLGATLGWMVGDEVGLWSQQAYNYLQDRLSDPRGTRQAYFTFTPKGMNWTSRVLGTPREGLEIIRATTFQNRTLPQDYLDRLRREHGEGSLYWRQEVLGEYVAWEGLVYPQFDAAHHVAEPPAGESLLRVVVGVDWGWTNPGVMLVVGLDAAGRYWVLEEVYERQRGLDWWVTQGQRLRDKWGASVFLCDPAEPGNIDALRIGDCQAVAANNRVLPGITAVASRFAADEIRFAEACVETIAELGMYIWKQRSDGTIRNDEPEKVNDHGMDALRYGVLGLLEGAGVYTIETW
jgi:hypothetical protein